MTMKRILKTTTGMLVLGLALMPFKLAMSATVTGMVFTGGCPDTAEGSLCPASGQADVDNVAAILGANTTDVTQIGEFDGGPNTSGVNISELGATTGDFTVTNPEVTHIAWKAGGYFILGKVTSNTGIWSSDPNDWGATIVTGTACPTPTICSSTRNYLLSDFLNNNAAAALSNIRSYHVVPVPAAVWLFGSGLMGMVGIARRKKAA